MKRLILILLAILLLSGLGFGLWRWLSPNQTSTDETVLADPGQLFPVVNPPPVDISDTVPINPSIDIPTSNTEQSPISNESGPVAIRQIMLSGNQLIYSERGTGLLYRFDPTTRAEVLFETSSTTPHFNTATAALSPEQDQLFVLEKTGQETIGLITDLKTQKQRLVFSSPFNQWLVSWPEKNTIVLQTKPAALAEGYLYFLNPKTGELKKIIGGLLGLSALVSPDGQKVLYTDARLNTNLYDLKSNQLQPLAIATLPEKCFWV
ncbi:MAG: hypothetical protein AAB505_02205, partial [Patescibacteria group bacterium]